MKVQSSAVSPRVQKKVFSAVLRHSHVLVVFLDRLVYVLLVGVELLQVIDLGLDREEREVSGPPGGWRPVLGLAVGELLAHVAFCQTVEVLPGKT